MAEKILHQDAIFVSEAHTQNELFEEIFAELNHLGYVKGDFAQELIAREKSAPTGIATRPLGRRLPNIAVPHLQNVAFYRDLLVPIRCDHVLFHNMLTPKQQIPVDFVFLLLTDSAPARTKLLARVVSLLKAVPTDELRTFLKSTDPEAIFNFLNKNLPD
jgi:mannitol/fructose-specific phosphotransferase system IIA component (Ntr-type)